jgi:hypothetical protein
LVHHFVIWPGQLACLAVALAFNQVDPLGRQATPANQICRVTVDQLDFVVAKYHHCFNLVDEIDWLKLVGKKLYHLVVKHKLFANIQAQTAVVVRPTSVELAINMHMFVSTPVGSTGVFGAIVAGLFQSFAVENTIPPPGMPKLVPINMVRLVRLIHVLVYWCVL